MCEGNLGTIFGSGLEENLKSLLDLIKASGFSKIDYGKAVSFKNRREMLRHFYSSSGAKDEIVTSHKTVFGIVATK